MKTRWRGAGTPITKYNLEQGCGLIPNEGTEFMKFGRLFIIVVVLLGAGYAWWAMRAPKSAAAPARTAEISMSSTKMAAPAATPPKPPVAAPIAPPVITAATRAEAAQPIAPNAPEPEPQADLNDCVARTLKLLEAKDVSGLVKTLMPPDEIQKMIASGRAASVEDIVAQFSQIPNLDERFQQLRRTLEAVKDVKPEMNAGSTKATYEVDPSIDGYNSPGNRKNVLTFTKVGGYWYMD